MAWIEEIEQDDADEELAEVYRELIGKRGKISNILKVHSLNPRALKTHLDLYMSLMFGRSGLSRAEREAIGVVTSVTNACEYCARHHEGALARYEKDSEVLAQIRTAGDFEGLPDRMHTMLAHASRLTREPSSVSGKDIEVLRGAGFADGEILDITLVTAYFNFVNRVALGLGVEFSDEELSGYKS